MDSDDDEEGKKPLETENSFLAEMQMMHENSLAFGGSSHQSQSQNTSMDTPNAKHATDKVMMFKTLSV